MWIISAIAFSIHAHGYPDRAGHGIFVAARLTDAYAASICRSWSLRATRRCGSRITSPPLSPKFIISFVFSTLSLTCPPVLIFPLMRSDPSLHFSKVKDTLKIYGLLSTIPPIRSAMCKALFREIRYESYVCGSCYFRGKDWSRQTHCVNEAFKTFSWFMWDW